MNFNSTKLLALAATATVLSACSVSAGSGGTGTGGTGPTGIVGVWSVTSKPYLTKPELDQVRTWVIGSDGKMSSIFAQKGESACTNYSYSPETAANVYRVINLGSVLISNQSTTRADGAGRTGLVEFKRSDTSLIAPDISFTSPPDGSRAYTLATTQNAADLLTKYCN